MRPLPILLAVVALGAAGLVFVQLVVGARTGPLPLVSVFEVHLLAIAVIAASLALLGSFGGDRGRAWLRLALVGVVVLGVVRLGDELWSPGPDGIAPPPDALIVLDWNLEMGSKAAQEAVAGIADIGADVVALQELTPDYAAAIESDEELAERYPYRILEPREGAFGLGLLARRPLLVRVVDEGGHVLHAGLLLDDGRVVEVLVVHPRRPQYGTTLSIPRSLDTSDRDADLASIRERIDRLDDLDAVLVVGDLNATPAEPARAAFGSGLTDAHLAVGAGPGFTWRPAPLEALDLALLRIDAVLTGDWLEPIRSDVDCTIAGDHCRLIVSLRVGAGGVGHQATSSGANPDGSGHAEPSRAPRRAGELSLRLIDPLPTWLVWSRVRLGSRLAPVLPLAANDPTWRSVG